MGVGHRVKSTTNPDMRVTIIKVSILFFDILFVSIYFIFYSTIVSKIK
jgi:hypothetical protein